QEAGILAAAHEVGAAAGVRRRRIAPQAVGADDAGDAAARVPDGSARRLMRDARVERRRRELERAAGRTGDGDVVAVDEDAVAAGHRAVRARNLVVAGA